VVAPVHCSLVYVELNIPELMPLYGRLDQYHKAQDEDGLCSKSKLTARKGGRRREKSTIESYHSGRHEETSALTQVDYSSMALRLWFPSLLDKNPWRRSRTDTRASKDAI